MAFNNEDILVLAKAGFTAEQIAALNLVGTAPAPAPAAPTQPAAPAPAPAAPAPAAPAPAAPAQPAPVQMPPTAAPHTVDDVLAAISGLTSTIQTANLMSAQMPPEPQKTAETILASIINPPKKEV